MNRFLPIVLILPVLAGCVTQPGPVDRALAASDAHSLSGPVWPDTSSERGDARLPGEFCDGFCRMRQQATSERIVETWRRHAARERVAELHADFEGFNAAAAPEPAVGDSNPAFGSHP